MAMAVMSWLIAIPLLGVCTGLRSMIPIALLCWYAWAGYLPVENTWAFWVAKPVSVGVFTLLALGELVGDKLASTPSRASVFPFTARVAFGGLVGALIATGLKGSVVEGVVLGVIGAVVGTLAGYHIRHHLVDQKGWPDLRAALLEDGITLVLSFFALAIVTG